MSFWDQCSLILLGWILRDLLMTILECLEIERAWAKEDSEQNQSETTR